MEVYSRLLFKSYMAYLPTSLPVYFYGMPDNKIYLVYARNYEKSFDETGLEFVFAYHKDFTYDYDSYTIYYRNTIETSLSDFIDTIEQPSQRLKIKKVYRKINSYSRAQKKLEKMAVKMLKVQEPV